MTLLNDFFHILSSDIQETEWNFKVALSPDHTIFKAHFPDVPVVPGVCQLGMVRELLSNRIGQPLLLSHIQNIKFMNIISPKDDSTFFVRLSRIGLSDGVYSLHAVIDNEHTVFSKMSVCFVTKT